jgi:HK97 family phage major capsid protein
MTDTTSRVAELEGVLEKKAERANELINSDRITVEGDRVDIPVDLYNDIKSLNDESDDINMLIAATKIGVSTKDFRGMQSEQQEQFSAAMAAAAGGNLNPMQAKTLGEVFVESPEFKNFAKSGRLTMDEAFELDQQDVSSMGTFDQKDVFTGRLTGAVNPKGFGRVQFDPAVPRQQRQYRVRDLFPVATTSANLIDYFRVLGFSENGGDGNAGPVRERAAADGTSAPVGDATDTFGIKPKSNLVFQSAQAPVRTIAHWEAAHRNILADEPQLQSTINNELLYGLALEEDFQLIQGDGTGENLLGVLNQPNTQSYTQATLEAGPPAVYEPKSDALRRAATKAIIANFAPTGYVVHPYDWEEVELQKDGEGRYMLITNVTVGMESRIWRQPVVETVAMPEGTFVTGSWGFGAQLYDRQVANVRIAEQHADFFIRNAVAVLVEERLAFAMKRPQSFVIGEFAA